MLPLLFLIFLESKDLFLYLELILGPWFLLYIGKIDLSSIDEIRGDFASFFTLFLIMWVFAAFGEEFLFRGYYMKALAELFGNNNKAWIFSAIITSLYFGISHIYQGLSGAVAVFLWSLTISLIFNKNRNNLVLLILIHGFYDSIGVTMIFLNSDFGISEWALNLITN